MNVVKFLGVIGAVLMVVQFADPIKWIKKHFGLDEDTDNEKKTVKQIFQKLLNCALCFGFWMGLAFYQDFYWAVIIAFASEIAYRIIDKLFTTIL